MQRIALLLMLLCPLLTFGQQDPMYSQYMYNGLVLNPAYAGSREALSLNLLARKQWVGIEGAPETQTASAHIPVFSLRHGFGLSVMNDRISYLGMQNANLDYAYRIPLKKGDLSLGLRASATLYSIDWTQVDLKDPTDDVLGNYDRQTFLPNAGFGIYYASDRFYAGVSVPRLLLNTLDSNTPEFSLSKPGDGVAALRRHYFLLAGYVYEISPDFQLKPSFLTKYVPGAPTEVDINLNAYFKQRFGVGASYRTGDGLVAMLEFFFTPQLRLGYAYDYPFTSLNGFTSGSHELMLGLDLNFSKDAVVSPRLF